VLARAAPRRAKRLQGKLSHKDGEPIRGRENEAASKAFHRLMAQDTALAPGATSLTVTHVCDLFPTNLEKHNEPPSSGNSPQACRAVDFRLFGDVQLLEEVRPVAEQVLSGPYRGVGGPETRRL
jgi:hypothetical protein